MELASEELERTQQRMAELALERDALAQRLEAAQEELEAMVVAVAESAPAAGLPGAEVEGVAGPGNGCDKSEGAEGGEARQPVRQRHFQLRRCLAKGVDLTGKEDNGEGFWERQVGEQMCGDVCLCRSGSF